MNSLPGRFPRRTHGIVGIEVIAGAVAVAMNGVAIALPHALVDASIRFAARRDFIDSEQRGGAAGRRGDLAGIELVVRIECGFEPLQRRI